MSAAITPPSSGIAPSRFRETLTPSQRRISRAGETRLLTTILITSVALGATLAAVGVAYYAMAFMIRAIKSATDKGRV